MPSTKTSARAFSPLLIALCVLAAICGVAAAAGVLPGASRASKTPARSLSVSGTASRKLAPGLSAALNLRLTNRRAFRLKVSKLKITVGIDAKHRRAGCSATRDFSIRQLDKRQPARALPAHRTRTLKQLGVRRYPSLVMHNLSRNQDACKGAKIMLSYRGAAVRAPKGT
jgi:hypothetical protein